jgi:hypothetical protein
LKEAFQAMAELKLEEIDITCDEDDAILVPSGYITV